MLHDGLHAMAGNYVARYPAGLVHKNFLEVSRTVTTPLRANGSQSWLGRVRISYIQSLTTYSSRGPLFCLSRTRAERILECHKPKPACSCLLACPPAIVLIRTPDPKISIPRTTKHRTRRTSKRAIAIGTLSLQRQRCRATFPILDCFFVVLWKRGYTHL
jgi:hypothetical protein